MSWYVEILLLNKDLIRSKVLKKSKVILSDDTITDEYTDLLFVENTLNYFINNGVISEKELTVLNCVLNTPNLYVAEKELSLHKDTISKIFKLICDRIAYKLGDYFTDEGYLAYLQNKYKLTQRQVDRLRQYMTSEFRYKIGRRIFEDDSNIDTFSNED